MGHYHADLMCNDCGYLRCVCESPATEKVDNTWVIGADFEVMRTKEYERVLALDGGANRTRRTPGMAKVMTSYLIKYSTEKEAKEVALQNMIIYRDSLVEKIESLNGRISLAFSDK